MAARKNDKSGGRAPAVLFAMEPRSYREMIGTTVSHLRPHLRVVAVEPSELRREMERLEPVLVVADRPEIHSRSRKPCWMYFSPYSSSGAEVRLGDERLKLDEVGLEDMLEIVDQSVALLNGSARVSGTG